MSVGLSRGFGFLIFAVLYIFATAWGGMPAKADVTTLIQWQTGPSSESYFSRRREGTPSTCILRQERGAPTTIRVGERGTLRLEIDCRGKPTGGKVLFESFKGRHLVGGWLVSHVRVVENAGRGTRIERLQVPRVGDTNLETRIRLVAERGRRVSVDIDVEAKLPQRELLSGRRLPNDVPWCDTAYVPAPDGSGFNCSQDSECSSGYLCSINCGNVCARRY